MARPHHRARSPAHREATVQLMAEVYMHAQVAVERGYRRPLTLATVARSLAVSPRQLERAYDEIGLTTFAAHLRGVRLRNAAELLAHQPLTVTDVARLVGYRQPSHFVKAFRRRFGTTPGAFRDAARRKAEVANAARDCRSEDPPPPAAGDLGSIAPTAPDRRPAHRGPPSRAPYLERPRSAVRANAMARAYSNPNSVDALWPDAAGGGREEDRVVGADCAPALAARADGLDDEDDAGAEPVVPPAPSKPNSLLA
jgi:AraC-like DNA-binding protein